MGKPTPKRRKTGSIEFLDFAFEKLNFGHESSLTGNRGIGKCQKVRAFARSSPCIAQEAHCFHANWLGRTMAASIPWLIVSDLCLNGLR